MKHQHGHWSSLGVRSSTLFAAPIPFTSSDNRFPRFDGLCHSTDWAFGGWKLAIRGAHFTLSVGHLTPWCLQTKVKWKIKLHFLWFMHICWDRCRSPNTCRRETWMRDSKLVYVPADSTKVRLTVLFVGGNLKLLQNRLKWTINVSQGKWNRIKLVCKSEIKRRKHCHFCVLRHHQWHSWYYSSVFQWNIDSSVRNTQQIMETMARYGHCTLNGQHKLRISHQFKTEEEYKKSCTSAAWRNRLAFIVMYEAFSQTVTIWKCPAKSLPV